MNVLTCILRSDRCISSESLAASSARLLELDNARPVYGLTIQACHQKER
jgi:hypothetical protein